MEAWLIAEGSSYCMRSSLDYDIAIVGAGVTGLTLAALLAKLSLRTVVISSECLNKAAAKSPAAWVSAITPGSREIFKKIGIWHLLDSVGIFTRMQIWDEQGGQLQFGRPNQPLGYIVHNALLRDLLLNTIRTDAYTEILSATQLIACRKTAHAMVLQVSKAGQSESISLNAHLVVGADGARSTLRELMHISRSYYNYNQTAVVAVVTHGFPHSHKARQIFLNTGPLALLPLANPYQSAVVWSHTPTEAAQLKNSPNAVFSDQLSQIMNRYSVPLGAVKTSSALLSFPLHTHHCDHYVKPHIALIGDAAHQIHPLAGLGLNLGLADSACLARVITEAFYRKREIGAFHTLKSYERERRLHNSVIMAGINSLHYLFKQQDSWTQSLRALGLRNIQRYNFLRRWLIQVASY